MNARIEKKLSNRLVELCPTLFKDAWISDDEPSELAYRQNSRITHCYHAGGGYCDYLGDALEGYSVWDWWATSWCWYGEFPTYPAGHEYEHFPDTTGFRPTTKNLIKLAVDVDLELQDEARKRQRGLV